MVEYSLVMKLFSANLPTLWSVTSWKLVECGFRTTPMGMQYMHGRSFGMKTSEKQSELDFLSCCESVNAKLVPSSFWAELSQVSGTDWWKFSKG